MALLLNDPSLSPNKQIKNPKLKTHHLYQQHHYRHQAARLPTISRQSSCSTTSAPPPHVQLEMVHASVASGGVFFNHYPNQFSLSSSLPPILPTYYQHHHHHHQQQQPKINPLHPHHQPPLLPLPAAVSKPTFHSLPPLSRGHSLSPPGPRKTKRSTPQNNFKKENNNNNNNNNYNNNNNNNNNNKNNIRSKELLDVKTKATKGPSNGSLLEGEAKEVSRWSKPRSGPTRVLLDFKNEVAAAADDDIKIIGTKFTTPLVISLSPPPSSLPLPRFPLKKLQLNKLSCNAEAVAGEVDSGATDNLCRLLKLR
ncbi:hypothetical protein BVRB_1g020620 [Beta vulgaris subsp. vulgaris]|uniref:Uncharacterized protein n=1 Tax=Beta vulgaris subsp. vulgaris TaxID=3555 RepID=A0A0J8BIF2_BETVV|nr:hypothetical protein BVRB_1g020620 [Beta vulgaris subsp. vulgaris]